jgi:hypothetical protein
MTQVRRSHLAMAMAILAGTLTAGPANACPPCGPMVAPVSAAPPVKVSPPPNVSGAVNSAVNAGQNAVSAATKEARDQIRRQRAAKARDRRNAKDVQDDLNLLVGGALNESWKRGDWNSKR